MPPSNINSGIIDLAPLYEIAGNDPKGLTLKGSSPEGRSYGKRVKELCKTIDDCGGFYMWGKYEKRNSLWRTIYLGKSKKAKTSSLQARIAEELKDERLIFWCNKNTDLNEKEEDEILKNLENANIILPFNFMAVCC